MYYAGKAFLCRHVVRIVAEEGLCLDVCSGGELAVALAAGFPGERIGLHGNNKSVAELERAVDAGVGRIVVDSFAEIDRLSAIARARPDCRPKVMVRVTVGVEAHTHEFIATAHEDQKFGFSLAGGAAFTAAAKILDEDVLSLRGLHSHIGSQIFDTSGFEVSARRVLALQAQIRDARGVELPELDLGGGFGIAYTSQDDPAAPAGSGQAHAQNRRGRVRGLRARGAAPVGGAGAGNRRPGGVHPLRGGHSQGRRRDPHVRQRWTAG